MNQKLFVLFCGTLSDSKHKIKLRLRHATFEGFFQGTLRKFEFEFGKYLHRVFFITLVAQNV